MYFQIIGNSKFEVEYLENWELTFDKNYIEIIPEGRGIELYYRIENPENPCLTNKS
jgi:hypothetical protein